MRSLASLVIASGRFLRPLATACCCDRFLRFRSFFLRNQTRPQKKNSKSHLLPKAKKVTTLKHYHETYYCLSDYCYYSFLSTSIHLLVYPRLSSYLWEARRRAGDRWPRPWLANPKNYKIYYIFKCLLRPCDAPFFLTSDV